MAGTGGWEGKKIYDKIYDERSLLLTRNNVIVVVYGEPERITHTQRKEKMAVLFLETTRARASTQRAQYLRLCER